MTSLDAVTQTIEQIGRDKSLLQLRDEVGTSNPDLSKVLCEGPLDMLQGLMSRSISIVCVTPAGPPGTCITSAIGTGEQGLIFRMMAAMMRSAVTKTSESRR